MSRLSRKVLLLTIVIVLMIGESLYFGRHAIAGYQQLMGRKAFINSEFGRAWEAYDSAAKMGGDRLSLGAESLDLLVFDLLQSEAGIDIELPVPPEESLPLAWSLVSDQMRHFPYEAHAWTKVADLKLFEARRTRRDTPIDLSRLSENPLDNLLGEEESAVEALQMAASLEPNNYFFHDRLVSFFLDIGATEAAARQCREAVASYPRLDAHVYLTERNLPDDILDAAIAGFRDATRNESLVREAHILVDAAMLLIRRGDDRQALVFLEQAAAKAPDMFDAEYRVGQVLYRLGDYPGSIDHFQKAKLLLPSFAGTYFHLGRSYAAIGDLAAAIEALTLARQMNPEQVKYRHELGSLLERAGRLPEAERQYVAAANTQPDDPVAWLELIRFYNRRQDAGSALEACERLLSLDQSNPDYQDRCDALKKDSR